MKFVSILDNKIQPRMDGSRPSFFLDFNLEQIIARIQYLSVVPVEKYYACLPADKECEEYRRQIYVDVKKTEVYRILTEFAAQVQEWK